ncbi:ATP-binding protein [candidate division WOR-3 bacterium]|nr:ATP-binding protein [candidate division WOR-3 bacterium]
MIYSRDFSKSIEPFIKRREFIAIIGPRQSGKTTFLGILRNYLNQTMGIQDELIKTVTFENRKLLAQFESDPVSFIHSYIPKHHSHNFYLMIDEFQYAVDGGQKLKLIYDTIRRVKIFITGSSSLDIKARVGKFMVGRILTFYLYPFNFREFLSVQDNRLERIYNENNENVLKLLCNGESIKIKKGKDIFAGEMIKQYEEFCIWGGYPAVVIADSEKVRKKLLTDIYNNYVLKDIKTLLELATERNLFMLSQYLATQIGNLVVYQNLSQVSALDYRKLKKHLNILKETYICQEVKPFFKNRQKELTKNPKIYFNDMGFRNNLMENFNSLAQRTDAGAVIENAVFIRLNQLYQGVEKINFWRTKSGAEVDFVAHLKNTVLPIEVKYSHFDIEKISRSLASFIDLYKTKYAVVLTKNYWGSMTKNKTKILFIPVYYV